MRLSSLFVSIVGILGAISANADLYRYHCNTINTTIVADLENSKPQQLAALKINGVSMDVTDSGKVGFARGADESLDIALPGFWNEGTTDIMLSIGHSGAAQELDNHNTVYTRPAGTKLSWKLETDSSVSCRPAYYVKPGSEKNF